MSKATNKKSKFADSLTDLGNALGTIQPGEQVRMLPVAKVAPGPYQPRTDFDEAALQDLADSITAQGVIQPIVVRAVGEGYEIVAGERRWRAAQLAKLTEIPAVVRDLAAEAAMAVALIENINRENLNALEEADGVARMVEMYGATETCKALGKPKSWVSKRRSTAAAPDEIRAFVVRHGVKDAEALYDLTRLHKRDPEAAADLMRLWQPDDGPLRAAVRQVLADLDAEAAAPPASEPAPSVVDVPAVRDPLDQGGGGEWTGEPAPARPEAATAEPSDAESLARVAARYGFGEDAAAEQDEPADDSGADAEAAPLPQVFEVELQGNTLVLFTTATTERFVLEPTAIERLRELLNG